MQVFSTPHLYAYLLFHGQKAQRLIYELVNKLTLSCIAAESFDSEFLARALLASAAAFKALSARFPII